MHRIVCTLVFVGLLSGPLLFGQRETTPLDDATSQKANLFFDVEAGAANLTICGFDLLLGSEFPQPTIRTVDILVFSRPGTALGFENVTAGWTLNYNEGGAAITSGGANTLKTVALNIPISVPANTSVGINIEVLVQGSTLGQVMTEFNLASPGTVFHTGSDLSVKSGTAFFFPGPFNPSVLVASYNFAGTIYYTLAAGCINSLELPSIIVGPDIFDGPGGGGPFKAGCVTIIQGGSSGQATVPPGQTLTAEPGSIVKPMPGVRVFVNGEANLEGSRWTSFKDDSLGGDSNGDGSATSPAPADWDSIVWSSGSSGTVKDSSFSYAGGGSVFGANAPTMDFNFADIPVTGSVFTNNASTGGYVLDFSGNSVPPEFRSNYIVDNGGAALGNVPFGALGGFRNNATANNGAANGADGDLLHAVGHSSVPCSGGPRDVGTNVEIDPATYPGAILVVRGRVCIANGGRLVLGPDTKIKFDPSVRSGIEVQSTGTLEFRGTSSREICVTSLPDDDVGGDTNVDGPSSGSPGDWEGIKYTGSVFGSGPDGCVNYTRTRYTGAANSPGLAVNAPNVTVNGLCVERGDADGVCFDAVLSAVNIAAILNAGCGVVAGGSGESHDLEHVTSRGNTGPGITADPNWNGAIRNSNSWDNLGVNIDTASIDPVRVFQTNGMDPILGSPTAGNMNVDPVFLGPEGPGLDPTSPLVDQASLITNPLVIREYDISGGSAVNGSAPDMGASEVASANILVSGELIEGGAVTVEIVPEIPTNPNFLAVSLNPQTTVVPGLGTVAGGLNLNDYLLLGPFVGPSSVTLPVPTDPCISLNGLPVSFQSFGIGHSGNVEMSNGWTSTIVGPPTLSGCTTQ